MSPGPKQTNLSPESIFNYLENSRDGITLISPEGIILRCNQAFLQIFGFTKKEIEGKFFSDVPFLKEEHVEYYGKVLKGLSEGNDSALVETEATRKDGKKIWAETSVTPLVLDGKLEAILAISRERTERMLMEEELKSTATNIENLLEGIADPYLLHRLGPGNSPGQIILCNKVILDITGYTRKEVLKMSITDFGHPESGLEDNTIHPEIMSGKPVLFERIITRKDKSVFPVEIHARLVEYRGEKMVLALLRDISRRKKEEEDTKLHLMFEKIVSTISSRFINIPDEKIDREIEKNLREISEFMGALRGAIYLLDEEKTGMSISHEWCLDDSLCQKPIVQGLPVEGFSYTSLKLGKLEDVILNSLDDLPEDAQGEREWYEKYGFNPVFYVPIISENKLVGTMGFTAENSINHVWPGQFGSLLRYIANVFYNAMERKEISLKLRRSQFTLDNYSDAVLWMTAPEYRVLDVNPAACKSLGYSEEEILNKTVYDFDTRFGQIDTDKLWKILQKEKNLKFESVHRNKSGKEFPVEIVANLIEFEGTNYIVAFARDITQRKEAEELIRKSEQEYRNIFENVAHVFYEASLDGKLLNVTPSVERLTNYRHDEIIGQPMEVFYYDPEVREPLLQGLYANGEVMDFELNVKDSDGSPVPANLNARIIPDKDGKPERIVGSLVDLRKRKKAEKQVQQLSTALEQSPVSVIITDKDTKILYVNNTFTKFSGLAPEEIIGSTPYEIIRGQVPLQDYNELWDTVKKGKIWKSEFEYTKRTNEKVWLSITVSPVLDEYKQAGNYVAILEEITERKKAEQELRKAKEQAEKSDYLKSAFLANMSHEIRTPMNAILGFSSLLKEQELEKDQSEYYIDIINSKGRDLLRIISDIIDISRIEAGDLYIKMEPVEVYPFMHDLFTEFKEDTQVKTRKNLQFRLNVPEPEKKIIINTDPARLKQVFVNLIQNALKFTPNGFVELGFETNQEKEIKFFVNDSGIGIPEDKKQIIFERFRQIDESHTREYGGTGLGLAICRNLLDLMGSALELESAEDQGSEFSFKLKYILTEPGEAAPETTTAPKVELNISNKKILIVEDDGTSYLFLESLLKRYGPEIIWSKTGKQALEILRKQQEIDLILMDIRLPEMDGLTATREIRKINGDVPIIAQTAYAQVSDRKLALDNGCNDYLSKPISPVDLTALLAKYL